MLHFVTVHVICMLTHGLAAGEGGQLMMVKLVVNVCCVLCVLQLVLLTSLYLHKV